MNTQTLTGELVIAIGSPEPLGATVHEDGINFAVRSGADAVSINLFARTDDVEPTKVVPMNKTGDVFHVFVKGLGDRTLYNLTAHGAYEPTRGDRYNGELQLIDPEAKMVSGTRNWVAPLGYDNSNPQDPARHLRKGPKPNARAAKCVALGTSTFDWEGDSSPDTPLVETVIYEVSVAGFTGHKKSPVKTMKWRGTYLGMIEMIPHLKKLGVTAVELLPIMAWYRKTPFTHPETGAELENAWGYMTIAFGAPDEGLATIPGAEVDEFKMLVRAMHKAGIEVILDIVVNHSPESGEYGPTLSLRGLDNKRYYILVPGQLEKYVREDGSLNFSGCANTLNCNDPLVRGLILHVLRRWVEEYHVDGFRFDLAAVLGINCDLSVSPDSPVLTEIANDPVLSQVKLIAEAWSVGVYLMGQFRAPWSEWNGRFRDTVRAFVRGEAGQVSVLATSICGSQDWFGSGNNRRVSINFVTAHDGFSLWDLVSYDMKHNLANGENNADGEGHNRSWNCGFEGDLANAPISEDEKRTIDALRRKQVKNFLTMLLVSRGVPMIVYGDEMGRTNFGNNNVWNQLELNQLDWSLLEKNPDLFRFACMMIGFRRSHFLGGRGHNPVFRPVAWHGAKPNQPDFSEGARFIAVELGQFDLDGVDPDQSVFVAANGYWEPIKVELPQGSWFRIVDTNLASGEDIVADGDATALGGEYVMQPRSTIVLMRK